MKKIAFFLMALILFSCKEENKATLPASEKLILKNTPDHSNPAQARDTVNRILDQWHEAAGQADFDTYFGLMSEEVVFIGTDAKENWNRKEFEQYAKPHFDKGQAWNFTPLERHIYFSDTGKLAWFDELLQTQMGICRGSGVIAYENGAWKVSHYVLSMTVPNEKAEEVTEIKKGSENFGLKTN